MQRLLSALILSVFCTPLVILSLGVAFAQVMESATYRIESDSLNFGGGQSTSSSYTLESTGGEIATGESESSTYRLRAGYQQMQVVYLAMTVPSDVEMSPSIGGVTGGISNGSTSVSVRTDSGAGYSLAIEASDSPAMQSPDNTIPDYSPDGAVPDRVFTTDATDVHFGYTVYGDDTTPEFLHNGAVCDAGSTNAVDTCWDGLSTTTRTIASASTGNHPDGATTTVYFRVGVGGEVVQPSGVYVATTTLTALSL